MVKKADPEANLVFDEKYSNSVRTEAKRLVKTADTATFALGQVIYTIWEMPIGPQKQNLFKIWGYNNFKQYCETELGIGYRRAAHLRNIWFAVEVSCKDVDNDLKASLKALGYSKLREVARILDPSNARAIVAAASNMSVEDVANFVQRHIVTKKETEDLAADAQKMKDKSEARAEKTGAEGDEDEEDSDDSSDSGDSGSASDDDFGERGVSYRDLEGNDEYFQESFTLVQAQKDCLLEAIDAARRVMSNPEAKKGHCLDMICTDFLANNDFPGKDLSNIREIYIKKIARALNVRLVAIDPKTGDIIYGMDALEALARTETDV